MPDGQDRVAALADVLLEGGRAVTSERERTTAYRLLWAGLVVAAAGAALWFAEFLPAWERLFR